MLVAQHDDDDDIYYLVNLFLRFSKFVAPKHFLSMTLRGIISLTNSNGDSTSPWKIPFWISTSVYILI